MALTEIQNWLLRNFYSRPATPVVFDKTDRNKIWGLAKNKTQQQNDIAKRCPALNHQIERSLKSGGNIQSAVFSECAYAQTYANMLNLNNFTVVTDGAKDLPQSVVALLKKHSLTPRYAYVSSDGELFLVQAGGCAGVDCALIDAQIDKAYTIEFKEPYAKATEADLPKYADDGKILITEKFLNKYPQYRAMLKEQGNLNFFERVGHNINDFSAESIKKALTENYESKHADVIITEDAQGLLTMLPANEAHTFAAQGEIRPAGRNSCKVWTNDYLRKLITSKGGTITGTTVKISYSQLKPAKPRGGKGITRYKINPLFFIRAENCRVNGEIAEFDLGKVRQLRPTIASKYNFANLNYFEVKKHYFE